MILASHPHRPAPDHSLLKKLQPICLNLSFLLPSAPTTWLPLFIHAPPLHTRPRFLVGLVVGENVRTSRVITWLLRGEGMFFFATHYNMFLYGLGPVSANSSVAQYAPTAQLDHFTINVLPTRLFLYQPFWLRVKLISIRVTPPPLVACFANSIHGVLSFRDHTGA